MRSPARKRSKSRNPRKTRTNPRTNFNRATQGHAQARARLPPCCGQPSCAKRKPTAKHCQLKLLWGYNGLLSRKRPPLRWRRAQIIAMAPPDSKGLRDARGSVLSHETGSRDEIA